VKNDIYFLDLEPFKLTKILAIEADKPGNRLNDAKCDAKGRLWTGTMDLAFKDRTASLYRIDPDLSVHVIDTGIFCDHNDFAGGRCTFGFDSTNEGFFDGNGHGTHVASTAVGTRFGLARAATTVAVKVLGSNGSGSFAGVIAGINWSANVARTGQKVVGNMSLGGGRHQATNDATDASVRAGLVMAVAAGNSNNNACNSSPASAPLAYTVMSTDSTDARSTFSSFGTCCKVFAPGTGITAAWIGAPDRTNTISGTSMASPHVAGIAAKFWSTQAGWDNNRVQDAITQAGNQNLVRNPGAGSPNVLSFMNCDSA